MAERLWVDRYIANKLGGRLIPLLERLFAEGYIGVIDETVVDIGAFQDNCEWVEEKMDKGLLNVEFGYAHIDSMTADPFVLFSCGSVVTEATDFFKAIEGLTKKEKIKDLYFTIIGGETLEEDEWESSPYYDGPPNLLDSNKKILKISEDYPSITEVFVAAKAVGRMDMFEKFCKEYVDSEALLHNCYAVLCMTGAEKVLNPSC